MKNEPNYEIDKAEQDMINQARMEFAHRIVEQELDFEDVVEFLEETERNAFDPFHIAMDWPTNTPKTTPGIAWGLYHLGYELTLERIALVKIALEAMENWGRVGMGDT